MTPTAELVKMGTVKTGTVQMGTHSLAIRAWIGSSRRESEAVQHGVSA